MKSQIVKYFSLFAVVLACTVWFVSNKRDDTVVAQAEFNRSSSIGNAPIQSVVAKDFKVSPAEASKLDFITIPQKAGTLLIVKAPFQVCGAAGCLFLGYIDNKQVLSTYLVDRLPVGENTFIRAKNDQCITVNSMRSYGGRTMITKDFCFDGIRYK